MKKIFAIAAASAFLAGPYLSAAAYAAPAEDAGQTEHRRFSADDLAALADARIAGLKAGLRLTTDQEKNWPQLEAALRDAAKARAARMAAWREQRNDEKERPDALARLRLRADRLAVRAEEVKTLAAAAEPLFKSLDDAQKRRFALLLHEHGQWRHARG
jgi:hypothetical protein